MRLPNLEIPAASDFSFAQTCGPDDAFRRHFQAHAPHYGLNADTLLSDEPLGQYSRLALLFALLPSAPYRIAPDIFAWRPLGYCAHFEASQHPARDFIKAAWPYAPRQTQFKAALEILCETSVNAVAALRLIIANGKVHQAREICVTSAESIYAQAALARLIAPPPPPQDDCQTRQNPYASKRKLEEPRCIVVQR